MGDFSPKFCVLESKHSDNMKLWTP